MATCEKCRNYAPDDQRRCDDCRIKDAAHLSAPNSEPVAPPSRIVGVDIPFMDLVGFFVKASFAAIPAAIVVAVVWGVVGFFLAAVFSSGSHR